MTQNGSSSPAAIPSARRSKEALPWARQTSASDDRVTNRARRLVQGLPDWEPLPPGEILVHRPKLS